MNSQTWPTRSRSRAFAQSKKTFAFNDILILGNRTVVPAKDNGKSQISIRTDLVSRRGHSYLVLPASRVKPAWLDRRLGLVVP